MSDNYEHFIPVDPKFVPDYAARERMRVLLKGFFPKSDDVDLVVHDSVEIVLAMENFERVLCPRCDTEIDMDWWVSAVDAAYETRFENLSIVTPCCGSEVSLNDLTYDWPQGFATFCASVRNCDREPVSDEEVRQLEAAAGCPLRVVFARI